MATLKAYAKINPVINVLNKRSDGYHNVDLLLQSIDLFDLIDVEINKTDIINISFSDKTVNKEKNNVKKAVSLFCDYTKLSFGANISITNNIPSSSGLGGSSVDAAAVLKYINLYFNNILSDDELNRLATNIGADVPFCLKGGFANAASIGEKLTYYPCNINAKLLIVKETKKPSTGEMYAVLDNFANRKLFNTKAVIKSAENGNYLNYISALGNNFEIVYPEINLTKESLLNLGADVCLLCGSGSAVCGFFENDTALKKAYNFYLNKGAEVFITKFKDFSFEIV